MDQPTPGNRPYHVPVMVAEVVSWFEPVSTGWIVDGTYGGGGHSRALLDEYPDVRVVGIDRDPDALSRATPDDRLTLVEANYRHLASILGTRGIPDRVDGILLDLGVSWHQLDDPSRGFSYHRAGPLDMRMGSDARTRADDIVNAASVEELAAIMSRYGEERFARRIAEAIVRGRPFADTASLASCIAQAVPAPARRGGHPARKSFQALRIAVNDELNGLTETMSDVFDLLSIGGRIVVMAYHSLEDRIVKRAMNDRALGCTCPPDLPVCVCGAEPDVRILTRKPIRPTTEEIGQNPRARSALLRVAEKVL
ncbi:MAG: 16S rRNA (cytosine(1402)-N(4))-methyltransferase RsmH [Acidimicrobiia bacterium]|nr:MAG: 16S rRNA (cytosine(1402)-N(4))-methyltransferase RsmH [Acidimicrobiia bacterium]